jgi:hypothetical protein
MARSLHIRRGGQVADLPHIEAAGALRAIVWGITISKTTPRELLALLGITAGAVLLHGYHGGAEDAEIYLPGVLKALNPALYPKNFEFFGSHAGMTLYPSFIAGSIRLSHLPVGTAMLLWHLLTLFGFLFGCFRVARLCFQEKHAVWCGVAFIASLLTLPIAGTALYIMDQYVTTRSFSTAASMLALACVLERRWLGAAGWVAFTMAIHPLMSLFLVALVGLFLFFELTKKLTPAMFVLIPLTLFPPITPAYRLVIDTHGYFLLTNWEWYEWLGMLAPPLMLVAMATFGRKFCYGPMAHLLKVLALFETIFFAAALLISMPGRFERFSEIQPMRCLLLVYIVMFLLGGCLIGQWILRKHVWRWAVLFVPLCAGMGYAQMQLFPNSTHVELPWVASGNAWMQGFDWIKTNTPVDAYFALDPEYLQAPGEDMDGFRANSQRSMVADYWGDSGGASMFPALAPKWHEEVEARRDWKKFQRQDFLNLKSRYGVDWVVLDQPGVAGLTCPYENSRIKVCRVE